MGKYFGTDGYRGVANKTLNVLVAYKIGRFIGYFASGHKNTILIARDTRLSGQMLAEGVAAGVTSSGGDVINIGVSTTPSISYLVRKYNFDFGVMISASHNPYFDNGIKVFNKNGEKLEESIELLIEEYIDSPKDTIPFSLNENIGRYLNGDKYLDDYLSFLKSKANKGVSNLNILVDCANGSASKIAPRLLKDLGVKADIINDEPNGININDHCGSTHIEGLTEKVKAGHYDIAFAFDGDADRCLAVSKNGKLLDGDVIMYMNAIYLQKHHELKENAIVLTVMSNVGLKLALKKHDIAIKEVGVGDKYVQAEMKKHGYSLGGEQSGHIIFLDDLNTGDGLLTMIKVMNILISERKDTDELTKDLIIFPQVLKNIVVTNKEAVLSHKGFNALIQELNATLDGGRILVRASGTEPLIRVMCEAKSIEKCHEICDQLIEYISELQ